MHMEYMAWYAVSREINNIKYIKKYKLYNYIYIYIYFLLVNTFEKWCIQYKRNNKRKCR